jgi:DNA-binding CsgD family transcriptional regulator
MVKRLAEMRRPLHHSSRDFSSATQPWISSQRHRAVRSEATTFAGPAIKASPLTQMSARELEILLLGRGDRISEVASELGISYKTVANTTSALKTKLGAKGHSDLVRIAIEIDLH